MQSKPESLSKPALLHKPPGLTDFTPYTHLREKNEKLRSHGMEARKTRQWGRRPSLPCSARLLQEWSLDKGKQDPLKQYINMQNNAVSEGSRQEYRALGASLLLSGSWGVAR